MPSPGGAPQGDLNANVAVLLERTDTLKTVVDTMSADLKATRVDIAGTYATKREVDDVREDVKNIKSGIGWAVKIVLGAVMVAVIGLVVAKGGIVHP